jgi:hypothetical protein
MRRLNMLEQIIRNVITVVKNVLVTLVDAVNDTEAV